MNRRQFVYNTTTTAGIALFSGLFGGVYNKLLAIPTNNPNIGFSFEILTDDPDKAISLISGIIPRLGNAPVNFTEQYLGGKFKGDIAFVYNNKLINFRKSQDKISKELTSIGKELKMPRYLSNPVLLSFRNETAAKKAEYINIFSNNILVDRIHVGSGAGEKTISSAKGEVLVKYTNTSAHVHDSSCKHKTCLQMGTINYPGQSIICIPNKIRVVIEGKRSNGLDGVSY